MGWGVNKPGGVGVGNRLGGEPCHFLPSLLVFGL